MPTIDELIEGKKPGEIKIRKQDWALDRWFQPYSKDGDFWFGVNVEFPNTFDDSEADWETYEEPGPVNKCTCGSVPKERPKIVRWLWAIPSPGMERTAFISDYFYTEQEALERWTAPWVKLEWSRTEFPE